MIGTFANNNIGVLAVSDSGSKEGDGLKLQSIGLGTFKATVTGNTIRQYNNSGINLTAGGGGAATSGTYEAIVNSNTVGPLGTNTSAAQGQGIALNGGTQPGDTWQIYLSIGGNGTNKNTVNNWISASALDDIRVRQRQSTTFHLTAENGTIGYSGGTSDITAVATFLSTYNTAAHCSASASGSGGGFTNGAPPLLFMPTEEGGGSSGSCLAASVFASCRGRNHKRSTCRCGLLAPIIPHCLDFFSVLGGGYHPV
ncbi:MAG: hypothetical protein QM755_20670 [Luteolibacter sp.]